MHTGDLGYIDDDGCLYIVDRLKGMIITGAENVYSAEVENTFAQQPAAGSCAVIGVPDPEWGERVYAVVVLRPGAQATAEELHTNVKSLIADYKAPRSVEFVEPMPGAAVHLPRGRRARVRKSEETQVQIAVVESWSWPTCSWNILSLLVLRVCELGVASSAVSSKHGWQFLFHGTPLVIVTRGRQAAVDPVEIACLLAGGAGVTRLSVLMQHGGSLD
ncbi:hypothetical protein ACFCWG_17560 [Streptomyces sp. NPDC056390]|uniref:AMP-binding enzyme n=1 Tax=Streptomyces sp. NPDC056390 TaxID=3345806 RepID=UPI0035DB5B94